MRRLGRRPWVRRLRRLPVNAWNRLAATDVRYQDALARARMNGPVDSSGARQRGGRKAMRSSLCRSLSIRSSPVRRALSQPLPANGAHRRRITLSREQSKLVNAFAQPEPGFSVVPGQ